jgi:hypothetical protein
MAEPLEVQHDKSRRRDVSLCIYQLAANALASIQKMALEAANPREAPEEPGLTTPSCMTVREQRKSRGSRRRPMRPEDPPRNPGTI